MPNVTVLEITRCPDVAGGAPRADPQMPDNLEVTTMLVRVGSATAVAGYVAKQLTRQEAASLGARRYGEWAAVFERAHAPAGAA